MLRDLLRAAPVAATLVLAACSMQVPRGMAVAQDAANDRGLVVVYPRAACAADGVVFLDARGTFLGAVRPGQGTHLAVPPGAKQVVALSIVDVNSEPGMYFGRHPVDVSLDGVLLTPYRLDGKRCGNGWHSEVHPATRAELDAAIAGGEIVWLVPRAAEGQAWIDAHRARVDEMLAKRR